MVGDLVGITATSRSKPPRGMQRGMSGASLQKRSDEGRLELGSHFYVLR